MPTAGAGARLRCGHAVSCPLLGWVGSSRGRPELCLIHGVSSVYLTQYVSNWVQASCGIQVNRNVSRGR